MRTGLWGRLPARLGGGKPEAQRLYETMRDGRGATYSKDDAALANREIRASARGYAVAASYQRRGAWQAHPGLATDLLPEWEQRLTGIVLTGESIAARQAVLEAVLAGNGSASYDNIVAALSRALEGESVSIVAAQAPPRAIGGSGAYGVAPSVTWSAPAAGAIQGVSFELAVAGQKADGTVYTTTLGPSTITPPTTIDAYAITVAPQPLSLWPAGVEKILYFLSVSARAKSSLALVAEGTGAAVLVDDFPRNPGVRGLHHLGIIVSAATWASRRQRSKIHAVLGTMLPGHVTYEIVTSSPFVLDTAAPPGSPLGMGAF